ncbi:MAG: alpha/beta hydrolase [Alphaproteobacteria bacterium]|nr:alpha/beta hydrolase [Alphaproteobacteria bacterium]
MTEMRQYQVPGATIFAFASGPQNAPVTLIWAHGWGQSHAAFDALRAPFSKHAGFAFDFPGFGQSPAPVEDWGTADYADATAKILRGLPGKKIWVGHSFGCRVGIQLAARHPETVDGLFLIAAAGLKPTRPIARQIYIKARVTLFKILKKTVPERCHPALYERFGSTDYKNAGPIRALFVRVVNEDLSEAASRITCPVQLVYGDKDTETPPDIGERFARLMPDSKLTLLSGQDHYSVLGAGRHPVAGKLQEFISLVTGTHNAE